MKYLLHMAATTLSVADNFLESYENPSVCRFGQ